MKVPKVKFLLIKVLSIGILSLMGSGKVNAQYYYNDIISEQQSGNTYLSLLSGNISHVSAICYDENNEQSDDFIFERTITNHGSRVETKTHLPHADTSFTKSIYSDGLIQNSTDSSGSLVTKTDYYYVNKQLSVLKISTDDNFMNVKTDEIHQWFYTGSQPSYMLRIRDNSDTTKIFLLYDDAGNLAEEIWKKKEHTIEHYFYYYNSNKQLTDIVRFNERARQMLPDFLIDYTPAGTISSLTQIPQGSSEYTTWQYIYDAKGLKQADILFDKQKQVIGKIEYSYH